MVKSARKEFVACCYCGQPATTRDHVPTRKLFPQPRPSDLITVPACATCNNASSKDEEYFIHVVLSHVEADSHAAQTLRRQLFSKPATARRVRMAQRMLSAMLPITKVDPRLGELRAFEIQPEPFERSVDKIGRGLYAHVYGTPMPPDRVSEVILNPSEDLMKNAVVRAVISNGLGRRIGDGVFEFRIDRDETRRVALCVLWFFQDIVVICNMIEPETMSPAQQ